jgi:Lrp/AsnC family transcriptional regulator for asnA, asnC and gidA
MANESEIEELDDIDKRIIQLLQENSRITLVDIAKEIGELTENAIRYRIDKLEDEGFIANYTIRLNPKKFGKNIMAIFDLNVLPENINEVLDYLKSIDPLTEIYLTTGNYSIIAIGYFENNNAVTKFITEDLKNVKMIDYDVITVLDRVKHKLYGI